jgi:hypothetical protein
VLAPSFVATPVVTLSAGSGQPGETVTVSVSGFDPSELVNLSIAGIGLGSVGNDSSVDVVVPDIAPGAYTIDAVGAASGASTSAGFEVLAPPPPPFEATPVVTVSAPSGYPGDVITAYVSGYHPDETVSVSLGGRWVGDTGNGGSVDITLPGPGSFEVGATGATTGAYNSVWIEVLQPEPQNQEMQSQQVVEGPPAPEETIVSTEQEPVPTEEVEGPPSPVVTEPPAGTPGGGG